MMSQWGVITDVDIDTGFVHVAPVENDGRSSNWHTCNGFQCWCHPVRDDLEPLLIIHNDPERGGYNA